MKWVKRIAAVLVTLLVLPVAVLLILGRRADAGKAQVSVDIRAPRERVWSWIDDGDKMKQWVSWMVAVEYPDPQKTHGAGAQRVLVMRDENNGGMLMRIMGTYNEYQPPARMTVQMADTTGMFSGEETYQLTDLGEGRTRLEFLTRYQFKEWFANLMEPVITPQARKKAAMDLAKLKQLVENQPQAAVR